MNRIISLLLCALAALGAAASVPASTRAILGRESAAAPASRADVSPYRPVMLLIDDESVVDSLDRCGAVVFGRRADILLASIPRLAVASILSLEGVVYAEASLGASSCLDLARAACNADAAINGAGGLPHGFTGEGVVAGFSDTGFDPHHLAFEGRVALLTDYDAAYASHDEAREPAEIEAWITDSPENYHATHVANILAGGYRPNGYYGLASGAEIAAATSRLSDVGILAGVDDIIAYAKEQGKPAVVNLSLSSAIGPHDGTSLACQYLSLCAEEAAICISAGNTAQTPASVRTLLTPDSPEDRYCLRDLPNWQGFEMQGLTDAWSLAGEDFAMRIEVFDADAKEVVWASDWIGAGADADYIVVSEDECPEWGEYMQGIVVAAAERSPINGRYNASASYDIASPEPSAQGNWARYVVGLAFRSEQVAHIDINTDASHSYMSVCGSLSLSKPGAALSINDLCTAPGVISVGASSTRSSFVRLDGTEAQFGFDLDARAPFSSWGTTIAGAELPHFSAPGNYTVSAISGPYLAAGGYYPNLTACERVGGADYYWGAECGTSMAAPYAAGAFCLWLEANPDLSPADLLEIAQATATPISGGAKAGAGNIDVLAGLKQAIARAGVVAPAAKPLVEVTADRRIQVVGADPASVAVCNVAGARFPLGSQLAPGIYVVAIPGHPAQKIAVE